MCYLLRSLVSLVIKQILLQKLLAIMDMEGKSQAQVSTKSQSLQVRAYFYLEEQVVISMNYNCHFPGTALPPNNIPPNSNHLPITIKGSETDLSFHDNIPL